MRAEKQSSDHLWDQLLKISLKKFWRWKLKKQLNLLQICEEKEQEKVIQNSIHIQCILTEKIYEIEGFQQGKSKEFQNLVY